LWKVKDADRIFGAMVKQFTDENAEPPRFTMMIGDQIYADMLNPLPLERADTYQEFQERYQAAFSSPNMRKLLRTAPTYMILDDHEIADNWTQDRVKKERALYNFAFGAYMTYQWSHGPRSFGQRPYYKFACGGYPFFVLDTRTERYKDEKRGLADNHLLGMPTIDLAHRSQLDEFLVWLTDQQKLFGNTPKFVVSASVFCPNDMSERLDAEPGKAQEALYSANEDRRDGSDSWPAFPGTRRAILDQIVKHKIQNVVFLTGDIHCANIARLSFEVDRADTGIVAYDITSSAFYWPFPFADGDPNNYVHDSKAPNQRDPFPIEGGEMNYRAWGFTQVDNFCRIDIDKKTKVLKVRLFDRNGEVIRVLDDRDQTVETNVLPFAPWT
jgi:alkaline phosphatase D